MPVKSGVRYLQAIKGRALRRNKMLDHIAVLTMSSQTVDVDLAYSIYIYENITKAVCTQDANDREGGNHAFGK